MCNLTKPHTTVLLTILLGAMPLYAFDMEAALVVYQDGLENKESQNVASSPNQKHTREYYQQKWLENQQNYTVKPVMRRPNNQLKNEQVAPEADDLFLASVNGNNAMIGNLLAQGLDVNVSNPERETALHMAAARGHYSTVIYLVNNGAYMNAQTIKNWIPLHHAVRFGHHNIVNYLVKRGLSAGVRTSDGLSSIDMAKNANDYRMLSILGAR